MCYNNSLQKCTTEKFKQNTLQHIQKPTNCMNICNKYTVLATRYSENFTDTLGDFNFRGLQSLIVFAPQFP